MKKIAKALYVLNKHAKSKRDQKNFARMCESEFNFAFEPEENEGISSYKAQEHIDSIYVLKNKVMEKLEKNHCLKYLGYTRTWNSYYGTSFFGCWKFCKISFHSQINKPRGKKLKRLREIPAERILEKGGKMPVYQAIKILKDFYNSPTLET